MNKFLRRVTITGADDNTYVDDLVKIKKQFPFVEFGILLSSSKQGEPRYPSKRWIRSLYRHRFDNLSAHICGAWVDDICNGDWDSIIYDMDYNLLDIFKRFQINTITKKRNTNIQNAELIQNKQLIFQLGNGNDDILTDAISKGINAVGLFDMSHGRGVSPDEWPTSDEYIGYAGGLGPDNIVEQLEIIKTKVNTEVWIDAETKLRLEIDNVLDITKVVEFLELSKPYVVE